MLSGGSEKELHRGNQLALIVKIKPKEKRYFNQCVNSNPEFEYKWNVCYKTTARKKYTYQFCTINNISVARSIESQIGLSGVFVSHVVDCELRDFVVSMMHQFEEFLRLVRNNLRGHGSYLSRAWWYHVPILSRWILKRLRIFLGILRVLLVGIIPRLNVGSAEYLVDYVRAARDTCRHEKYVPPGVQILLQINSIDSIVWTLIFCSNWN